MRNKKRLLLLAAFLLLVSAALAVGTAYARYREVLTGDPVFQVNPMNQLTIADYQWQQTEDAHTLTFAMEKASSGCRVFLAVSEGVQDPQSLTVTLTLPGDTPVVLQATPTEIPEGTPMYKQFGPGCLLRFIDPATGEEAELNLTTQPHTLTVEGLGEAAEQTSLLRLFVERIHE